MKKILGTKKELESQPTKKTEIVCSLISRYCQVNCNNNNNNNQSCSGFVLIVTCSLVYIHKFHNLNLWNIRLMKTLGVECDFQKNVIMSIVVSAVVVFCCVCSNVSRRFWS